ncbi:MAG: thioredoxin family protein [Amaricoccus sp.]
MPRTESNAIVLGAAAPDFVLPDATGQLFRLDDFAGRPALLVAFVSNRCPFVLLIREALARFGRDYATRGVAVVAVNSNDAGSFPEESLARLGEAARAFGFGFPYLKDADQAVAKRYGAACTPDLFLYDGDRRLAYHGQFDGARPGNGMPTTGADLRAAVDAVLAGERPSHVQQPSVGCNIKWLPGNAPSWFRVAA